MAARMTRRQAIGLMGAGGLLAAVEVGCGGRLAATAAEAPPGGQALDGAFENGKYALPKLPYALRHNATTYLNTYHEYVGYGTEAEDVARIIVEAELLSKLRYRVESAFMFHPHLIDISHLQTIIAAMKAQRWQFPPLSAIVAHPHIVTEECFGE